MCTTAAMSITQTVAWSTSTHAKVGACKLYRTCDFVTDLSIPRSQSDGGSCWFSNLKNSQKSDISASGRDGRDRNSWVIRTVFLFVTLSLPSFFDQVSGGLANGLALRWMVLEMGTDALLFWSVQICHVKLCQSPLQDLVTSALPAPSHSVCRLLPRRLRYPWMDCHTPLWHLQSCSHPWYSGSGGQGTPHDGPAMCQEETICSQTLQGA